MPKTDIIAALTPEITAIRRDIHRHPELMYEVHRTAARVAALLRDFGCDEVVEGIGRTGVVGVIAAIVLFQLYNVLGKRVGRQPQEDAKAAVAGPTPNEAPASSITAVIRSSCATPSASSPCDAQRATTA